MKHKFNKYVLLLAIITIAILAPIINVSAAEEEIGTVQVNYGYLFEDGSLDVFHSAPAIVINSDTLITYDMTSLDFTSQIQERAAGYNTVGINTEDIRNGFVLRIYQGDGKYIAVTEYKTLETSAGNILILKSAEKLDHIMNFSPRSGLNDENIYATGYPAEEMDGSHFISEGSSLKQGVKITSEEEGIIKFSIDSNESYKGGALINDYNELYGFIIENDNGGTAISSDTLAQILDQNSIIYSTGEVIVPIDYTKLHSATDAAVNINRESVTYTEESLKELDRKIKNAEKISKVDTATQGDVDAAAEELESAIENLEEVEKKPPYGLIIGLIVGAVILIIIAVLAILCIQHKDLLYKILGVKKKENNTVKPTSTTYIDDNTVIDGLDNVGIAENKTSDMSRPAMQPQKADFSDLKNFQGGYIYEDRQDAPIHKQGENLPDTSVLKNDIASNNEIIGTPYIIRVSTGERILINRNQYTIGRDFSVDYRIPENISISKIHCRFMAVGHQWYIIDNNSSNKTLVNGIEIPANESVPIYDKTEIVLANEKLIFRYLSTEPVESTPQTHVSDTGILSSNTIGNMQNHNMQPQSMYPAQQSEGEPSSIDTTDDDPDTNVLTAGQMPDGMKVPYLIIKNKKIKITQFPFSLGRGKMATYKYTNDHQVSREHIVITKEDGKYYIRDNKSSNGTMLNNEPMDPLVDYFLNNGDIINIMGDAIEFHV